MSNFVFLQSAWPTIFAEAKEAERLALLSPKASAILARSALELAVNWMYDHDKKLTRPYSDNLSALIFDANFQEIIRPARLSREIELIRRYGNSAAHGSSITEEHSIVSVKNLFRFLGAFHFCYSLQKTRPPAFSLSHIPDGKKEQETLKKLKALEQEKEQLQAKEAEERKKQQEQARENESLRRELERLKQEIADRREERNKETDPMQVVPVLVTEKETRERFIDLLLRDAGWEHLQKGKDLEYKVTGLPKSVNPSGTGYADYVLWGKDGKPLAVIEAKRTMLHAESGRHQAELYADCLEKMHGQRPIIFYTNGFETYLYDDTFYSERQTQGFYTQDELQLLIDRRLDKKDLRNFSVNHNIINRPYQLEALRRVAEAYVISDRKGNLKGFKREALLVMATGSGKTRTAAAIVDMLFKCNWVKRVLFLADRNALVTQAKKAFNNHLPELSSIDLTRDKVNLEARLVFSTYPTMMNQIDHTRIDNKRYFGVGHFDLIIIDETHRSVYQKYKAIFEYFDSLLLGLTATPKKDFDKNTYSLFQIEDDNPTFAYELDAAVKDKYLVPAKAYSVPLKFQREGIKYHELSEKEKQEYEEKFGDPSNEEAPDSISSEALNNWLFNQDTVDKVLEHLMKDGIKVEGGDKIGKTIIFAKNHNHAEFIKKRFEKNYPEYSNKFLQVIDNYIEKAEDLVEKFSDEHSEKDPQIAVSVDMMDTGVDAPRVVNLVFFKLVRSVTKFWQMIGRGTRLCPDLFAPGVHKKEFLIFDYCENFEFFEAKPEGYISKNVKSLQQQIFEAKARVLVIINQKTETTEEEKQIKELYAKELQHIISTLDEDRFIVQKQWRYVKEYSYKEKWLNLNKLDLSIISEHLSHLEPPQKGDDDKARRFDVLVHSSMLYLLETNSLSQYTNKIAGLAKELEKKANIPQIAKQIELIQSVQTDAYWQKAHVHSLEELRKSIRSLIKYLDPEKQEPIYTNFKDKLDTTRIDEKYPLDIYTSLQSYKDRVESYIRNNKDHITIYKLRHNESITEHDINALERILFTDDVAGSKEQFVQEYGERPLGVFIRSITGLETEALNQAFAEFLQAGNLRGDQMTFVKTIINYLAKNGTLEKRVLNESPFIDINDGGLSGVFPNREDAIKVVKIIDAINGNADVA
ncbi:MAG: DEAD/DEAH box helicase family protein [Leptospiraceae bacterium]|nr:DEAD/DEAH box helicase family protein [Leptospiraceae bacterium]MCP5499660.1 DEAD/DEAH box helicase family protein [Leptospiraceae bacterium]